MFANKNKTGILDWIPLAVLLYLLYPYVIACVYSQDIVPAEIPSIIKNTSDILTNTTAPVVEHTWYNYITGKDPSYNTWGQFFTWGGPDPSLYDYVTCNNTSPTYSKAYTSLMYVFCITASEQVVEYFTTDPFTTKFLIRLITSWFS